MSHSVRSLAAIVKSPVPADAQQDLAAARAWLPQPPSAPRQMVGPEWAGAAPPSAAGVPAPDAEEIERQLELQRPALGAGGSVRLTDAEVTLRPFDEAVGVLRHAHSLGLVPVLVTHGDVFHRRPGLLERLMWEGGLADVSIHVDTTQRGRKGAQWRDPENEAALNPLRDEFAEMVREARRRTGLPLRAATAMVVTRDNLAGVPDVLRWLLPNTDAFRMICFQAAAEGSGVSADELWARIAEGVGGPNDSSGAPWRGQTLLGDSGRHRVVHGVVARRAGVAPAFHPLREAGNPTDERVMDGLAGRFGDVTFRRDSLGEAAARLLGLAARAPWFVARNAAPYALHWLRRLDREHPLRAARELASGALRVNGLAILSHHPVSGEAAEAAPGEERLGQCVFQPPAGGRSGPAHEETAPGVRPTPHGTRSGAPAAGAGGDAPSPLLDV